MKNKINQFLNIHKNEIVDNLCKLVKIESISKKDENFVYGKNSAAALEFCLNLAKEKNLSTQNHEYICGEVMLNKVSDKKRLVIASHCDVVECDDDNIYPNFYGEVVNNYVVGRGVVDDKGPLIATLYALAFFKENNIPIKNDIRLLFGCNEENGMDDIFYYLVNLI
ncbi:MAG: M20/M25/M40 family metallo-hydrolase [Oscillospiraceae bacterium]